MIFTIENNIRGARGIVTQNVGRLANCMFRNFAVSSVASKHNLYVRSYAQDDVAMSLGISFYKSGKLAFDSPELELTDNNFSEILFSGCSLCANVVSHNCFFQTQAISQMFYNYLRGPETRKKIMAANPYADRYQNNADIYIHVRLGDVIHLNPGLPYYLFTLSHIKQNNECSGTIYVSSDSPEHETTRYLIDKCGAILVDKTIDRTIQFASTCKYIILSHGSFSAFIGYLSFYSDVFYPKYNDTHMWHGDMFSIRDSTWNKVICDIGVTNNMALEPVL
jgi:hypothetical protein